MCAVSSPNLMTMAPLSMMRTRMRWLLLLFMLLQLLYPQARAAEPVSHHVEKMLPAANTVDENGPSRDLGYKWKMKMMYGYWKKVKAKGTYYGGGYVYHKNYYNVKGYYWNGKGGKSMMSKSMKKSMNKGYYKKYKGTWTKGKSSKMKSSYKGKGRWTKGGKGKGKGGNTWKGKGGTTYKGKGGNTWKGKGLNYDPDYYYPFPITYSPAPTPAAVGIPTLSPVSPPIPPIPTPPSPTPPSPTPPTPTPPTPTPPSPTPVVPTPTRPSEPTTMRPTASIVFQCSSPTGETGLCGVESECTGEVVQDDICPSDEVCCVQNCDINDVDTECCVNNDCGNNAICSDEKICVCAFECCTDADCGNADLYSCVDNQCELDNCNVTDVSVECCSTSDCGEDEVCEETVCVGSGSPRFTLSWFGNDDLDLYVVTPNGVRIGWDTPRDNSTGGVLDQDDIPASEGRFVENIFFPDGPDGTYTFYVVNYEAVVAPDAGWTISVYDGEERIDYIQGGALGNQESSPRFSILYSSTTE